MNISAVVPAYNEEKGIYRSLKDLNAHLQAISQIAEYEIIVVDDGSKDSTVAEAKKVEIVKVIQNTKNQGYGASLKRGINEAKYEIILITDSDGTYPLDKLDLMCEAIRENEMVVGERNLKFFEYPILRRVAKWILRYLVYFIAAVKIKDLNSGLRLIRKDRVKQLFPIICDGFSFTTTVTLAFNHTGYSIKYIPIDYKKREGASKIRPFRDTLSIITLIFSTVMYFNPLKVFLFLAGIFFIFTIGSLFIDIFILKDITDKSIIFLSLSVILFFAGIFADLINKKFEVLNREIHHLNRKRP